MDNGQHLTITVERSEVRGDDSSQQQAYTKRDLMMQFSDKKALDQTLTALVKKPTDANESSGNQQGQQSQQQSQQTPAQQANQQSDNGQVMIAGHSFHHADFYGNDILVGDNNEGEAVEYFANVSSMNQDQRDVALHTATSQEHPRQFQ